MENQRTRNSPDNFEKELIQEHLQFNFKTYKSTVTKSM